MYTITTDVIPNCSRGKPLVLAVDANEDNLLLMSHLFEYSTPCVLLTAKNGEQGLSMARNYMPNLILLEVTLPDINGLEIIQELKQNRKTSQIPVVAVTSLASRQEREKIFKAGCDEYLSKPYLLEDLEAIVYRYTNNLDT